MTKTSAHSRLSRRGFLGASVAAALGPSFAASSAAANGAAPVLYVSHGSPLFLPGNETRVAELRAWGATLESPRGILVMTPHYASRGIELGRTKTGFAWYDLPFPFKRRLPQDLEYATPPSDGIAARVETFLSSTSNVNRSDRTGFDHTTWMPLSCLFPKADVPVLEITYPYMTEAELFRFGERLAPLRDEGILFLASGGMTHNLASFDGTAATTIPPWATEFDAWAAETILAKDVDALVDFRAKAPAAELAHPDDGAHFRVLLVALGIAFGAASRATRNVRFPVMGFEAALSKRCVEFSG